MVQIGRESGALPGAPQHAPCPSGQLAPAEGTGGVNCLHEQRKDRQAQIAGIAVECGQMRQYKGPGTPERTETLPRSRDMKSGHGQILLG